LEEQIVWIRKLWDVVGGLPMRTPQRRVRTFGLSLIQSIFLPNLQEFGRFLVYLLYDLSYYFVVWRIQMPRIVFIIASGDLSWVASVFRPREQTGKSIAR
jgi:hypothetical protein